MVSLIAPKSHWDLIDAIDPASNSLSPDKGNLRRAALGLLSPLGILDVLLSSRARYTSALLDAASEMYASPRFLEYSRRARDDLMLPVRSRLLRHPSAYKQCAADFPLSIHEVAPAVDTILRLAFLCLGVEQGNLLPPISSDHSNILRNIRWGHMQQSKSTDDLDAFPSSRTRELLPFLRTAPSTDHRGHTRSAVAATQASTRQYLLNNAHELFCRPYI